MARMGRVPTPGRADPDDARRGSRVRTPAAAPVHLPSPAGVAETRVPSPPTHHGCGAEEASLDGLTDAPGVGGKAGRGTEGGRAVSATSRLPSPQLVSIRQGPEALLAALRDGKTLRVGMNMFGADAGLFVYVTFVLNHLALLERWGVARDACVHVHFGPKALGKRDAPVVPNMYHDPAVGDNVWDYFFEPLVHPSRDCPDPAVAPAVALDNDSLLMLHEDVPESVFAYPHGVHAAKREDPVADEAWYRANRDLASRLLRERVRVKAKVRCAVEAWWRREILGGREGGETEGGKGSKGGDETVPKVLGVHLRGTDKRDAVGGRVVEPKEHFPLIDDFLERHGSTSLVFVATDDARFLDKMRRRYGDRMRHYEQALRSKRNAFKDPALASRGYEKGESALIDALLLSRCDALLKPSSAVSEFAVYFSNGRLWGVDGGSGGAGKESGAGGGNVREMQFAGGYSKARENGGTKKKAPRKKEKENADANPRQDVGGDATDNARGGESFRLVRWLGGMEGDSAGTTKTDMDGGNDKGGHAVIDKERKWAPLEVSSADLRAGELDGKDLLRDVASGVIPAVIVRGVITPGQAAAALAATPAVALGKDRKGVASANVGAKQVQVLGAYMHDVLMQAMDSDVGVEGHEAALREYVTRVEAAKKIGDGSGLGSEDGTTSEAEAAAAAKPLAALYETLRALSPSRDVRRKSVRYSPAVVRAFQPGSRFPLHFDSLQSYEWDLTKGKTCGKKGAKGRRLWKNRRGSPTAVSAKARALFRAFGLDAHNDTLSVALVLQSAGSADHSVKNVESVLYSAHWRKHLLADCAVTGESHVLGVNIELAPLESNARTGLRSAVVKGGGVGQPGVAEWVVKVAGFKATEVSLGPGDLYVFGANRLHQVSPVKGPLARVTLGAFISFDENRDDVLVWA